MLRFSTLKLASIRFSSLRFLCDLSVSALDSFFLAFLTPVSPIYFLISLR
jgi:hypothetical protein